MTRIQIITLLACIVLLSYVSRLVLKGKLRVEYSIFWIVISVLLVVFTFWTTGFEMLADELEVYEAPNLIFTVAIFIVFIYLLHLSVVNSKLQKANKKLTQEIALLNQKIDAQKK
ncbi:MAG: DUF2304 domain-containing protein [Flavobacteriales bacterium]